MVAALVPQHLMGFILGMWFLTRAAAFPARRLCGDLHCRTGKHHDPLQTLPIYTGVLAKLVW